MVLWGTRAHMSSHVPWHTCLHEQPCTMAHLLNSLVAITVDLGAPPDPGPCCFTHLLNSLLAIMVVLTC